MRLGNNVPRLLLLCIRLENKAPDNDEHEHGQIFAFFQYADGYTRIVECQRSGSQRLVEMPLTRSVGP